MHFLKRILQAQPDLLQCYRRSTNWVLAHTIQGKGVAVSSCNPAPYPEVSGYFIPTLRAFGERDLALQYARWLVSIQGYDGSWRDPAGTASYTFDTGQILKGLLSVLDISPEFAVAARRGCDWLLQQVQPDGRVTTPDTRHWSLPRGRMVPEAIHLYALEPLRKAGRLWGIEAYEAAVEQALRYYLAKLQLTRFDTLSHFHAYIVEALIDLDQIAPARTAMEDIRHLQRRNGVVPAYHDVRWVCSTGLFQYAVIWYRLGDRESAERAFHRACRLQNPTGGFYGSYGWGANYFPREEIAWAVKYFMDATWWKIRTGFDQDAAIFPDTIDAADGRYRLVLDRARQNRPCTVLDAGCGKGRLLRRLREDLPDAALTGMDISDEMLRVLPAGVRPLQGSLLDIPAGDGAFEMVVCVEALEHAVNISGAIRELCRVLTPGGTLVIIDKNCDRLGRLQISEWEQWFTAEEVADLLRGEGLSVKIDRCLSYNGNDGSDGLFLGWVAKKG